MEQHGSKYFAFRPPPPYSTFSEQCCVAYQFKGNHECSNMVTNILPADLPPPPPQPPCSWGSGQNSTFSEHGQFDHVAYQIKGITNAAVLKQILCPQPPPPPP